MYDTIKYILDRNENTFNYHFDRTYDTFENIRYNSRYEFDTNEINLGT